MQRPSVSNTRFLGDKRTQLVYDSTSGTTDDHRRHRRNETGLCFGPDTLVRPASWLSPGGPVRGAAPQAERKQGVNGEFRSGNLTLARYLARPAAAGRCPA
jgi:hypothetical protein